MRFLKENPNFREMIDMNGDLTLATTYWEVPYGMKKEIKLGMQWTVSYFYYFYGERVKEEYM